MAPALFRALRPWQWPKNLFVLAPLVFAKELTSPEATLRALATLAVFCGASSAIYLINDIRDLEEDRLHPAKRGRPLASGSLAVPTALLAAALLATAAVGGGLALGLGVAAVVAAYLLLNVWYSIRLKHVVILDVMAIAAGFVLRILGGAAAIHVAVSNWLILCTIFLSLFLAFSKRRHELVLLDKGAAARRQVLSHYSSTFLDQMINVVTASTVVAYALYAVAPETVAKLGTTRLVYTLPMVLFGVFRYLYLIYQRPSARNPTEAILTDAPSLLNLGLWVVAVLGLVYWR